MVSTLRERIPHNNRANVFRMNLIGDPRQRFCPTIQNDIQRHRNPGARVPKRQTYLLVFIINPENPHTTRGEVSEFPLHSSSRRSSLQNVRRAFHPTSESSNHLPQSSRANLLPSPPWVQSPGTCRP